MTLLPPLPSQLERLAPRRRTATFASRELCLGADPTELAAARDYVEQAVTAFGFDRARGFACVFAVNEALTNAIRYGALGAGGRHPPSYHRGARQPACSPSTAAARLPPPVWRAAPRSSLGGRARLPDASSEGGRGLPYMELLMDRVELDLQATSTTVRLYKRARLAAGAGVGAGRSAVMRHRRSRSVANLPGALLILSTSILLGAPGSASAALSLPAIKLPAITVPRDQAPGDQRPRDQPPGGHGPPHQDAGHQRPRDQASSGHRPVDQDAGGHRSSGDRSLDHDAARERARGLHAAAQGALVKRSHGARPGGDFLWLSRGHPPAPEPRHLRRRRARRGPPARCRTWVPAHRGRRRSHERSGCLRDPLGAEGRGRREVRPSQRGPRRRRAGRRRAGQAPVSALPPGHRPAAQRARPAQGSRSRPRPWTGAAARSRRLISRATPST